MRPVLTVYRVMSGLESSIDACFNTIPRNDLVFLRCFSNQRKISRLVRVYAEAVFEEPDGLLQTVSVRERTPQTDSKNKQFLKTNCFLQRVCDKTVYKTT